MFLDVCVAGSKDRRYYESKPIIKNGSAFTMMSTHHASYAQQKVWNVGRNCGDRNGNYDLRLGLLRAPSYVSNGSSDRPTRSYMTMPSCSAFVQTLTPAVTYIQYVLDHALCGISRSCLGGLLILFYRRSPSASRFCLSHGVWDQETSVTGQHNLRKPYTAAIPYSENLCRNRQRSNLFILASHCFDFIFY